MSIASEGRPSVVQAATEIDLGGLGRALWRKKFWIVGLTLLAAGLAFAIVNLITPRYKSEARVLVETRENIFLRPDQERSLERNTTVDQEAMTSQVQLILSRDLAREVIKKLKLADKPEFDPVLAGPSLLRTILSLTGIIKDPMEMTPEERVFKSYYARLSAFQVEKSRVIAIEFESQDPELAAEATNAIAEGYLALQQTAKQGQTRSASAWLAGEIDRLRKNVAQAEAKVEQYRSRTNLFIGNNNTTLSNQQLGDYNAQLASARALKADAESKAKLIREALKSGGPIEFADFTNSELLRRLSEQRVTLRAQLAEQSSTLLDQHPRIKELRAQINDLERQMRGEADRLARSLENDAKLASAKVDSLSAGLDQLKRQAGTTNEQDVELRALERDAKSQRDLLESYLAKYREATARDSIGAASPDARIISQATVSTTASWPKKLPTVLVAALAMFALSSGFVLTGELLGGRPAPADVRVASAEPASTRSYSVRINRVLARPAIAAAPAPRAQPEAVTEMLEPAVFVAPSEPPVFTEPAAPKAESMAKTKAESEPGPTAVVAEPAARVAERVPLEAIDTLAHDLAAAGEAARRITVIGVSRNVGATMAAIALARILGRQSRVALIDLALGSPNLSIIASDPTAPGIAELVRGSASFGQIITRDRYSRVHLIMAGREAVDPSMIMNSQRLAITLEALGRSYDHVVVDAGTMDDAVLDRFAGLAPRAVLVAGELEGPTTSAARERLLEAGFADVTVLAGAPRGPGIGAMAAA